MELDTVLFAEHDDGSRRAGDLTCKELCEVGRYGAARWTSAGS